MAIVPGCPGLVVEVLVDGVPLQEYNDDEDEEGSPGITTKYIEAHSGSSFTIRFSYANSLPVHPHLVRISLDGQRIYTRFYLNSVPRQKHAIESRISKIGEQTVCRKFQFRELDIIDGDTGRVNKKLLDKLSSTGAIKVAFQGIYNIVNDTSRRKPLTLSGIDVVPEKALKGQAKSHRASLSNPRPAESLPWYKGDDVGEQPFATFHFKYRSRASLQALHILPRTPTPVPLEERPEEELSPEELRQVVKRLKEQREAAALKIKKEHAEKRRRAPTIGDDSDVKEDFEIVEAPNKRRRRQNPEDVIVLD